jgi:hypothetical protein
MRFTLRSVAFTAPVAAVLALAATTVRADEISDAIAAAAQSYKAGELSAAKQSLDLASQLISQQNADRLIAALPKALPGWKAEGPDTSAGGGFGFAITQASQRYTNSRGDDVEVSISGDSPFLTQLAATMTNPQLAGLMGKIVTIGSQRGIQTKEGEVNMVVANRFVITVNGGGTAEDKLNYAKGVDFNALNKLK